MKTWLPVLIIMYLVTGAVLVSISKRSKGFLKGYYDLWEAISSLGMIVGLAGILITVALFGLWPLCLFAAIFIDTQSFNSEPSLQKNDEKEIAAEYIGKEGICVTDLMPTGRIRLDEQVHEAICNDGFIESDTKVVIVGKRGFSFVVQQQTETS